MSSQGAAGGPAWTALIRDVPDFPRAGRGVQGHHAAAGRPHRRSPGGREALAAAGRDGAGEVVVDKVAGIEARGFILAAPVALALGVGFVPVRKAGKLPARRSASPTPWSTARRPCEIHQDAFAPGGAGAA